MAVCFRYVMAFACVVFAATGSNATSPLPDGSVLTAVEMYERCYLRMVRAVPPATDPILVQVKAGKITPAVGCIQLLDKALFVKGGQIADPADPVARSIVRTFHDFHGGWFQSRVPSSGLTQQTQVLSLLVDMEGPGLYLTRALFANTPYGGIVKGTERLAGIRNRGKLDNLTMFEAQRIRPLPSAVDFPTTVGLKQLPLAYRAPGSTTVVRELVPNENLVQVGELVGVKSAAPYIIPAAIVSPSAISLGVSAADLTQLGQNVPVNRSFGGGIVGSPAFLAANANLGFNIAAEGDASINRVATSRIFEDLLCHQLPTLQAADIDAEKSLVDTSSPLMFRRDRSCMQCHAQIDYAAYGYRNLIFLMTEAQISKSGRNMIGFPTALFSAYPVNSESKLYRQTAPTGTLRFRGHRAGVTRQNFSNLEDLGAKLSETRDFYECAAKRYYKFFTGIDVPLGNFPALPTTASKGEKLRREIDLEHQRTVIGIAARLQKSQSLRTLVSDIVNSTAFKVRNFRSSKEIPNE